MTALSDQTRPTPTLTAASARAVSKTYGSGPNAVQALRAVDLSIRAGTFTAIMGASGSGKSTLMHCLAGLDRPSDGVITVAGTELQALGDDELTRFRRDHLGFVFQAFNLLPMLTAAENIRLPIELAGGRIDQDRYQTLTSTLGLRERLRHRPHQLSGGQQQRVAIARALVGEPDVVFADEPTGNLDSDASAEVLGLLRASVDDLNQTVVMVTHELSAALYADEVVLIADGRAVATLVTPSESELVGALRESSR